jgi:hypothetical protein
MGEPPAVCSEFRHALFGSLSYEQNGTASVGCTE